ncbi:MAG: hypothetical protein H7Y20_09280 [Bryobacteraceae bacterium]|nr:hypothetical protein [Bryobacteraceae bacterium]
MRPTICGSLLLCWASLAFAQISPPQDPAPLYVESSIANSASPRAEGLAPNTLATLYGKFLSHTTRSLQPEDIAAGILPTTLRGTGVRVIVGGFLAPVLYISPTQVNFVVPPSLLPGDWELRLGLDSRSGPAVRVRLSAASPALFSMDPEFVIATRGDGSLLTNEKPGKGGEIVVLYATGLGTTLPPIVSGQIVVGAAGLERMRDFRVELNGEAVAAERVLYAGLAPGFAGLYQVNLRLPEGIGRNPVIRIGFSEVMSPEAVRLHAE